MKQMGHNLAIKRIQLGYQNEKENNCPKKINSFLSGPNRTPWSIRY